MSSYSYYNLEEPNAFDVQTLLSSVKAKENPQKQKELSNNHLSFIIDESPLTQSAIKGKYEYIHSKTYEVQGICRYTQPQNMKDKIDTFFRKQKERKNSINKEENEEENHKEKQEDVSEDKINNEMNRYFNQNPSFFCFRCKKPGHFQKTCPEEDTSKPKCVICLDESHHFSRCESFICYKCLKAGHMARDCKFANFSSCYRCGKRGHKAKDCGILVLNDEINELDKEGKKIVCLTCSKKGHVNCNNKGKKIRDNVYLKGQKIKKKVFSEEMISNLEYFEDIGPRKRIKKKKKTKKKNKKKKK